MSDTDTPAILALLAAVRARAEAATPAWVDLTDHIHGPWCAWCERHVRVMVQKGNPVSYVCNHDEGCPAVVIPALLAVAEAAARLREADADLAASFRSSGGRSNAYTMKRVEVSQRRARLDAALSALVAEGGGA